MDSDGKFYFLLCTLLAAVLIAITIGVVSSDIYATKKLQEMVASGVNPVAARCALYGSSSGSPLDCNLFMVKGAQ